MNFNKIIDIEKISLENRKYRYNKQLTNMIRGDNKYTKYSSQKIRHMEYKLEGLYCDILRKKNIKYRKHFKFEYGEVDIITKHRIYEVKYSPVNYELFRAVGQVLIYKDFINKNLEPWILTNKISNDMKHAIENIGIKIKIFNPKELEV